MARGSIAKKGNNYYIVYRVNGKERWKAAGPNKKRADRMLVQAMGQIHDGRYQELKEITFGEFATRWLADYAKPRVKASTYSFYDSILELYLVPYFGEYKLQSITTRMLEQFLARESRETNLSATTIGYHLRVMKTVLKRAIIWGYLSNNPARYIEKPRAERKEMDFLTPEELRQFLQNVGREHYPLFLTTALTGMRRGEILALKWSDINWATDQIHVRRSLVLGKLEEPKSRAATRVIIVPPMLISVLRKHRLSCAAGSLDLVFPNKEGKVMNPGNLYRRQFLPALRRAGLRKIRLHDLRHTYASLLIAEGENLKYVQQQLGHSSAQITLDRYGHLMPQVQHGAGERLQKAVFGSSVRKTLEEPASEELPGSATSKSSAFNLR
ncbi:MAG: tyrosine-type recombinase/integrase [Terriglobia bacterium]